MENFFKKIQRFPQNIKEKKEKLARIKQELILYLLKGDNNSDLQRDVWSEFGDLTADGKLLEDKEIFNALKEGYLLTLKQYLGELPTILKTASQEEGRTKETAFIDRIKSIINIFKQINFQKWERNKNKNKKESHSGNIANDLFFKSFNDNPEFFRLTKESLIKSLNEVDISAEYRVYDVQDFISIVPDEVKKSLEVQKAVRDVMIRSLRSDNLSVVNGFKERFELTEEMIQSPDLQQAALNAVEITKEKLKKISEKRNEAINKLGIDPIDSGDIWQEEERIRKIEEWIIKKEIEK